MHKGAIRTEELSTRTDLLAIPGQYPDWKIATFSAGYARKAGYILMRDPTDLTDVLLYDRNGPNRRPRASVAQSRQKPRVSFSGNVSRHCAAELCTASRLPVDTDAYSKTHLAAYANDLIAHLDLVIAYVELGRYQEARAEVSEVKRISPNFVLPPPQTSWFKDVALNQRWETELRKPGLK